MKCEEYRKFFSDFIDGELSEEHTENLRNHLKSCETCKKEFDKFRQSHTLLKLLPKKQVPPELWEVVEAKIRHREKELVFFFQSVGIFDRLGFEEKSSSPTRIYGISFGMPSLG